jgi:hypothetical protein
VSLRGDFVEACVPHCRDTHFTSDDEVKQAVTSWIKQRTPEFFIDGMRKLVLRW